MTIKVELYQVRDDIDERHDISFMNYEYVSKKIPDLKRNFKTYYKKTYEFEDTVEDTSDDNILEDLFTKFNIDRPEDFKGHSMSVSDIVILDDDRMYFCDSMGFQEIE